MNNVLTQIKIDLYSSTSYEVIKAQQGDRNSRIIEFVLYNRGKPYEFSGNIFFRFVGHRGDGSSFSKTEAECITRNGNHVRVTLPEDVLYYDGTIEAKLVMYELGDTTAKSVESKATDTMLEKPERTVLSTIPFKISCIKNPCNENNLSEGELSIVTDLIFQMEEFSKNAQNVIDSAQEYATLAQSYAVGGTGKRENEENDNAMHYYNQTKLLESSAKESKDAAKTSELNAAGSAATATQKSDDASGYAKQAQSYALGTGNARPGEDQDNAKHYYEQAKSYAVGDTGKRENEENNNAKYYCEEAQKTYDLLKLSGNVTGVKGDAEPETAYHTGNVNLTPDDIGTHSKSYINAHFVPDYTKTVTAIFNTKGWYRIAQAFYHFGTSCTITLKRFYNNKQPEYQKVQLIAGYTKSKFVPITAFTEAHDSKLFTKMRLVRDAAAKKDYIEVYYDSQFENTIRATIDDGLGVIDRDNWGMITPEIMPESADGVTIVASTDLPSNLDAGNYLQSEEQIPVVGKDKYIAYPNDAYYNGGNTSSATGYIKIALPVSWTNTFIKFTVSIYSYLMGESCEYHVAGYNYAGSGGWNSCMAVCVAKAGTAHANLPVRFGHDGTKCVVCIGEVNTSWNHPVAQIHDVVLGYSSSNFDTWKSGWNLTISTTLPSTISRTISNTHVAYGGNADTVDGKHASDLQNYNNLSNKPTIPAAVRVKGNAETTYRTGDVNITPANIGALSTSGGTITGNLRLKGSGNYGNVLNFGDGDYVHLSEPEDDVLEIRAKKINLITTDRSGDTNGVYINGLTAFSPHLLWSGGYYMTGEHIITLSESLSKQPSGIVLVWSDYTPGTITYDNIQYQFVPKFIPNGSYPIKFLANMYSPLNHVFKKLNIYNDRIVGDNSNISNGTTSTGIKYDNHLKVLINVLGV